MTTPTGSPGSAFRGRSLRAAALLGVSMLGAVWLLQGPMAAQDSGEGAALYAEHCAGCHEGDGPPLPHREDFAQRSSARILSILETGIMKAMAAPMSAAERATLAAYLGSDSPGPGANDQAYCADRGVQVDLSSPFVWNGWSPDARNTRFQPAGAAGLTIDQVRNLKLKWAFGFEGDLTSFSQPAVVGDQVFVGSSGGTLYALRAGSGCIQWRYQAAAPVRTAIRVAPLDEGHVVLFGDQTAWVYAVSAETGQLLWRKHADEHPAARITGSPAVFEDRVYVPVSGWEETFASRPGYECCTFRGSVVALNIADGSEVWKSYTIAGEPERLGVAGNGRMTWGPSGAGTWSAPTIDAGRGLLYVTTGNNYSPPVTDTSDAILAMELATGRIAWSRQVTPGDLFSGCRDCFDDRGPDFDFGSSAILVPAGGGRDLLIAGQKSGVVWALDPDRDGEVVWQTRVAGGSSHGGIQWGMASDGQYVYAPIADGALGEPDTGGGLAALRVADGTLAWRAERNLACEGIQNCSPGQLAAASAMTGVVFSGAMDGHIRAYSAEDGAVLWDFSTLRAFDTVNGVPANGGALNGNGPVVANGMLFVNSGYDHFGSINGNVLLMFAP